MISGTHSLCRSRAKLPVKGFRAGPFSPESELVSEPLGLFTQIGIWSRCSSKEPVSEPESELEPGLLLELEPELSKIFLAPHEWFECGWHRSYSRLVAVSCRYMSPSA